MNSNLSTKIKTGIWLKKHKKIHAAVHALNIINYSIFSSFRVLPNFLIIGTAKAGTTSLYEYLIKHPCIIPAIGKEIYFFDKEYSKGTNWYKSFFPTTHQKPKSNECNEKFITGEATPRYLFHPHAPRRVKELLPNVKLIVLLRNPVDRAYSHYQMEVRHGNEKLSFEEAIEAEQSRVSDDMEKMEKDENFYSVKFYRCSYLTRGIYVDQLKRWLEYFPREQFLILESEDLYQNTSDVYNQVLQFLELPKFSLKEFKPYKKSNYSVITLQLRNKLNEFFKQHNERLEKLLERKFDWG